MNESDAEGTGGGIIGGRIGTEEQRKIRFHSGDSAASGCSPEKLSGVPPSSPGTRPRCVPPSFGGGAGGVSIVGTPVRPTARCSGAELKKSSREDENFSKKTQREARWPSPPGRAVSSTTTMTSPRLRSRSSTSPRGSTRDRAMRTAGSGSPKACHPSSPRRNSPRPRRG